MGLKIREDLFLFLAFIGLVYLSCQTGEAVKWDGQASFYSYFPDEYCVVGLEFPKDQVQGDGCFGAPIKDNRQRYYGRKSLGFFGIGEYELPKIKERGEFYIVGRYYRISIVLLPSLLWLAFYLWKVKRKRG